MHLSANQLLPLLTILLLTSKVYSQSSPSLQTVRVVIDTPMKGYQGFEDFATQAAGRLECVFNSQAFRDRVKASTFRKTHKSGSEVLQAILNAQEEHGDDGDDHVVTLKLRTINEVEDESRWLNYHCNRKTVGKDGNGDGIIATCPQALRHFRDSADVAGLASHYAHEYMHHLGFSHGRFGKDRTVPVVIDKIVEELAANCSGAASGTAARIRKKSNRQAGNSTNQQTVTLSK